MDDANIDKHRDTCFEYRGVKLYLKYLDNRDEISITIRTDDAEIPGFNPKKFYNVILNTFITSKASDDEVKKYLRQAIDAGASA